MLLDVPQQDSHRPYARAVATALERARVAFTEVAFPADDADLVLLRRAWLCLNKHATAPLYGEHHVAVGRGGRLAHWVGPR